MPQEIPQKYKNVICKDNDLLFISSAVKKSLTEVCKTLKLERNVVKNIEKQDMDDYKKIFSAFIAWCEISERATWGELAETISDDEEMLRIVIDYLTRFPPRVEDEHELNSFPFAIQETKDRGKSGQIVTGSCNGVIDPPHLGVKRVLQVLQGKFGDLEIEAEKALESQSNIIGEVRIRLTRLCVDTSDQVKFFDQQILELITKMNIPDIFVLMSRNKVWEPINYSILMSLVNKCIPPENKIHQHFKEYSDELKDFQQRTFLRDYMAIIGPVSKLFPHGCTTIAVKFEKKYGEYTMADFAKDQAFLEGEFFLHQSILHFKESQRGCVNVTWFIPKHALQFLAPQNINQKREALRSRGIVEIIVGEKHIYRFPFIKTLPPLSPIPSIIGTQDYDLLYEESISNPEEFWGSQAKKILTWTTMFHKVNGCVKEKGSVAWFAGGQLNVSVNCLDRHAKKNAEKTAIIWERNRTKDQEHGVHECISYRQLLEMTCRIANVLIMKCGVKKGDKVIIYMPTCPLAVAAMLACSRVGAVHCVLYSVLGVKDLEIRIKTSKAKVVITAPKAVVGDKSFELKKNVDDVLTVLDEKSENTVNCVLVGMTEGETTNSQRDLHLEREMETVASFCEAEPMESEDPLFIMYTSGTTGKPAGIVHTQAGYLLYAAMTHKHVFDYKEGEVFACVSVLGWITGHTYVVYGPLCNGATTVLFEGTATYPDPGRYWEMVERLKVNHFYTSPAAIRKMMKADQNCVGEYDTSSLRTIASVGEPLPTAAWEWYYQNVGKRKCVVIDTYWQTELGGIVLSPQPGDSMVKSGACSRPFFGVEPVIVDEKGTILEEKGVQGLLCLKNPIPGMGRRVVSETSMNEKNCGDESFRKYFETFPGLYFTGDWAYRDIDGDYQIVGRKDDIVRIKGVWIQVPEIESSIAKSEKIENASYICLSKDTNQTTDETCLVIELRETKPETPGGSIKFYEEIIDYVKTAIIHSAGISALPVFVLLVRQNIQTWSEKLCRSIWREHASMYMRELPVENRDKMTLIDISNSTNLPCVADSEWEHLPINTSLCI